MVIESENKLKLNLKFRYENIVNYSKKKEKIAWILIHQQKVITSNRTENNIIINITMKDVSHRKTYAFDHVYIYIHKYIYIYIYQGYKLVI